MYKYTYTCYVCIYIWHVYILSVSSILYVCSHRNIWMHSKVCISGHETNLYFTPLKDILHFLVYILKKCFALKLRQNFYQEVTSKSLDAMLTWCQATANTAKKTISALFPQPTSYIKSIRKKYILKTLSSK